MVDDDSASAATTCLYDLIIVGGGVVGLAILRAATLEGWNCALVEREPDLLSHASGSNSGIVCTGVDAAPGTLERALIRDSISQLRPFCEALNIPIRPVGSLVCQWSWDKDESITAENDKRLHRVLQESHEAGDTHATLLSTLQVQALEPNLASSCQSAVHIPGEVVLDPWVFSIALAAHARENGAHIVTNFAFDPEASFFQDGAWTVLRQQEDLHQNGSSSSSSLSMLRTKAIVNAAGLWAETVQAKVHGTSPWTAKPRRGQYRLYKSSESTRITHPIQPIPTQRTKGIMVFSTLYDTIVVGPTALDQDSKTDGTVDPAVAADLDKIVKKVIPKLDVSADYIGDYVGIRPGTNHRDYQIHLAPHKNWIAVAGIRSTGLTASLGIGNSVVRQLHCVLGCPEKTRDSTIRTTPLPSLNDMIRDFDATGGYVTIHHHQYRVTHALTKFGWMAKQGMASPRQSRLYTQN